MTIVGSGLFRSTIIEFDDPVIRVIDDVVHRRSYVPDSVKVQVLVNAGEIPQIGLHRLALRNPFTREVEHFVIVSGPMDQGSPARSRILWLMGLNTN